MAVLDTPPSQNHMLSREFSFCCLIPLSLFPFPSPWLRSPFPEVCWWTLLCTSHHGISRELCAHRPNCQLSVIDHRDLNSNMFSAIKSGPVNSLTLNTWLPHPPRSSGQIPSSNLDVSLSLIPLLPYSIIFLSPRYQVTFHLVPKLLHSLPTLSCSHSYASKPLSLGNQREAFLRCKLYSVTLHHKNLSWSIKSKPCMLSLCFTELIKNWNYFIYFDFLLICLLSSPLTYKPTRERNMLYLPLSAQNSSCS